MLDSIKVGIPLTLSQHKRILKAVEQSDRYRWVLFNDRTQEILFRQVSGLASTDQHSYHRELRWDAPKTWSPDAKLVLEFSIPKFWYGHNIRLLHDFMIPLRELRASLNRQFNLKRLPLPDPAEWTVMRLDPCYAYRFPNQKASQLYLDGLKHLSYPKKKPILYETSIVFPGQTYSLKFYLKHPEFRQHDMKALIKSGSALEWVNLLEDLARGVLRCEATLRSKYLQRQGIRTVSDLLKPIREYEWDSDLASSEGFDPLLSVFAIAIYYAHTNGINFEENIRLGRMTPLVDGMRLEAPKLTCEFPDGRIYNHPGGGYFVRVQDRLTSLLRYFITRFLGENVKMQSADEVKAKLLETYKPVKASRLTSFWLYVQRFGESDAKEIFGKDSFYRSKRDVKKAGVSLVDEPKLVTRADQNFLRNFELIVPSPHATNHYDDARDSLNVLDFVPMTSGNPFC